MNVSSLILVIDDDRSLLMGVSEILKRGGYEVITATNGTDGIQLALESSPSLIISDMMMPTPDGSEVLRILSKHNSTVNIPFILLTARTDEKTKVTSLKNGADDYITKPFSTDELLGRVKSILRRKEITKAFELRKQTELRKAAEEKLSERREENVTAVPATNPDTLRLIHELQVHKIELGMQNEQLIDALAQAEEAYRKYSDLYDLAPVGYLTLTRSGTISKINLAGATMLGKPRNRLIDRMLAQFILYGSLNTFEVFFSALLTGNGKEICELNILNKNNEGFWVQLEATCFVDGQECRVIMVDINVRKLAEEYKLTEEILRVSEAKFRNMFANHAAVMLLIKPATGDILDANIAAENFYGYPVSALSTMNMSDLITLTKEEIQIEINGALDEHRNYFNFQHRLANGKIREVEVHSSPLTLENKLIQFSIIHDITDRKQAEEGLRIEHWRMENIIEGAHVGTWEWNVQTGEVVFNELWAQLIGYTLEELGPKSIKTIEKFIHPDDLIRSNELLQKHFSGELPYYDFEYRMKHKDGHWIWIHGRGQVISHTSDGTPLMMFGTQSDITQRKQAEFLLSEAKLQMENIIEGARVGTWEWNIQTDEQIWNEMGAGIMGYTLQELMPINSATWEMFAHPDDLEQSKKLLELHFANNLSYYEFECRMKHKDGHWVWIQDRGRVITRTDDGKPLLMFGTLADISERKKAEFLLQKFARAVEQNSASIIITDADRIIEYANPQFTAITGYSLNEVIGKTSPTFIIDLIPPKIQPDFWQTILSGREWHAETMNRKKNGELYWEYGSISALTDPKGNITHYIAVNEDISIRKAAEEKIQLLNIELEKLAITDFLTKLYNRRYFMQRSDEECKRASRSHQPLTLLMLDIDHFKKVNDTYGHEAGDLALQHVAEILRSSLREIDILGRMGGEEFAVLMPNTTLEDAVLLAERIRLSITNTVFDTSAQALTLTVSIGAEIFTAEMSGIDELLRNADVALYRAKNSGRNCVVAYPSPYEEGIQTSGLGSSTSMY